MYIDRILQVSDQDKENKMVLRSGPSDEKQAVVDRNYDRKSELQSFDNTKEGVKGLVDTGITRVPRIFIHPPENVANRSCSTHFTFPVIDLASNRQEMIVQRILEASESWGFFQVVNHGIPLSILEETLSGIRRFYEQETEIKQQYYTRDFTRKMVYNSNFDLYSSPAASWRDSFTCITAPDPPKPEELPTCCAEILLEYSEQLMNLGIHIFKLLATGLGLNPDYLVDIDCAQTLALICHYYPACPEPELTLGTPKHSDYTFLTLLLQDSLGGLQVLHQGQWIDVPPSPGAMIVNIGELLQLISNDKVKSVDHRVLVSHSGPRISVAGFFGRDTRGVNSRMYGPIKELVTEENPAKYRPTTIEGYTTYYRNSSKKGSTLQGFRI